MDEENIVRFPDGSEQLRKTLEAFLDGQIQFQALAIVGITSEGQCILQVSKCDIERIQLLGNMLFTFAQRGISFQKQ